MDLKIVLLLIDLPDGMIDQLRWHGSLGARYSLGFSILCPRHLEIPPCHSGYVRGRSRSDSLVIVLLGTDFNVALSN